MRTVEILDARPSHLSAVAGRLRPEETVEISAAGETARHLIYRLWRDSPYRRAGLVDGEIAAVWGCSGMLSSSIGEAWLFTTPVIDKNPLIFVKVARREISRMLETKTQLVSACLLSCERSVRLWTMLGFRLENPVMLPNGAQFNPLVMER